MWSPTRLRVFSVLRRPPPPRRGRRLPRPLRALPEPRIRSAWNRLGDYTRRERREVVHGDWRTACAVQLVSDATDRDRGGFDAPVSFPTDEAAAEFVTRESTADEQEAQVPTLQAARLFFSDLARTADGEVDVESLALHSGAASPAGGTATLSQAERVAEARDVHRHFFADYYIQQGLVHPRDKFDFVDAMRRPARALFQVNAEKPLQRVVVRHQLEQHHRRRWRSHADRDGCGGVVFAPTAIHPLIYAVAQMPTQRVGEPEYVPYTAEHSILARREAGAAEPHRRSEDGLCAQRRVGSGDDITGRRDGVLDRPREPPRGDRSGATRDGESDRGGAPGPFSSSSSSSSSSCCWSPPSLHDLQWLQRQLATDSLVHMDALSPLICIVAARAALSLPDAPAACRHAEAAGAVVLDLYGAAPAAGAAAGYDGSLAARNGPSLCPHAPPAAAGDGTMGYYRDVAHYLATIAPPHSVDGATVASSSSFAAAGRVTVVAALSHAAWAGHSRGDGEIVTGGRTASIPLCDRAPALVYACRPRRGGGGAAVAAYDVLRGKCAVVLCTPDTSNDGIRPQHTLPTERRAGGDGLGDDAGAGTGAVDHFVHVCAAVAGPARVASLCAQLRRALRYVDAERGGWVIYATHSLNPLKNEAVVCATLTAWQHAAPSPRTRVTCVSLRQVAAEVTGMDDAERAVLCGYDDSGRRGLTHWCTVAAEEEEEEKEEREKQNSDAEQHADGTALGEARRCRIRTEPIPHAKAPRSVTETGDVRQCCPRIVAEVAAAAWRSEPMRDGRDGSFFLALRVHRTCAPVGVGSAGDGATRDTNVGQTGRRESSRRADADADADDGATHDSPAPVHTLWCAASGECALMPHHTWRWVKQMLSVRDTALRAETDSPPPHTSHRTRNDTDDVAAASPTQERQPAPEQPYGQRAREAKLGQQERHRERDPQPHAPEKDHVRQAKPQRTTVEGRAGWRTVCAGVPVATMACRPGATDQHAASMWSAMSNTGTACLLAQRLQQRGAPLLLPPPGHSMHWSATGDAELFRVDSEPSRPPGMPVADSARTNHRHGSRCVARVTETESAEGAVVVRATGCAVPLTVLLALLRRGIAQSCSMREWLRQAEYDLRDAAADRVCGGDGCRALYDDLRSFCRSLHDAHERLAAQRTVPHARSSTSSSLGKRWDGYLFLCPVLPPEPTQRAGETGSDAARDGAEEEDDRHADARQWVLHPAVAEELRAVRVVVRVTCVSRASSSRTALPGEQNSSASSTAPFASAVGDYIISLRRAPGAARSWEHGDEEEAMAQVAVGLGDAVEYVLRKMHRPVPRWGHTAQATARPTVVAELAEDEFALVNTPPRPAAAKPMIHRHHERQRWTRPNRKLRRANAMMGADGREAADWVQERRHATEAARRREAPPRTRTRRNPKRVVAGML